MPWRLPSPLFLLPIHTETLVLAAGLGLVAGAVVAWFARRSHSHAMRKK